MTLLDCYSNTDTSVWKQQFAVVAGWDGASFITYSIYSANGLVQVWWFPI